MCGTHIVLEAPVCTSRDITDSVNKFQTKSKSKHKRKKNDSQNCEGDLFIEESFPSRIIDMSVNKSKKKKTEDDVDDIPQIHEMVFNDMSTLECDEEPSKEHKSKKRKMVVHANNIEHANSYLKSSCAFKKHKSKTKINNYIDRIQCNDNVDFTVCESNNMVEKAIKDNSNHDPELRKCNTEVENHVKFQFEKPVISPDKNSNNKDRLSKHHIEHLKSKLHDNIDKLLLTSHSNTSCSTLGEQEEISKIKCSDRMDEIEINEIQLSDEKNSTELSHDHSEIFVKRRRIRKHNKKRKKEKKEYFSAVGPVLDQIFEPQTTDKICTPTSVHVRNHKYFSDEDFEDVMEVSDSITIESHSISEGLFIFTLKHYCI